MSCRLPLLQFTDVCCIHKSEIRSLWLNEQQRLEDDLQTADVGFEADDLAKQSIPAFLANAVKFGECLTGHTGNNSGDGKASLNKIFVVRISSG